MNKELLQNIKKNRLPEIDIFIIDLLKDCYVKQYKNHCYIFNGDKICFYINLYGYSIDVALDIFTVIDNKLLSMTNYNADVFTKHLINKYKLDGYIRCYYLLYDKLYERFETKKHKFLFNRKTIIHDQRIFTKNKRK